MVKKNAVSLVFIAASILLTGAMVFVHDATVRSKLLEMGATLFTTGMFAYRHDTDDKRDPSQPGAPGEQTR
jgi:hypothetical protein